MGFTSCFSFCRLTSIFVSSVKAISRDYTQFCLVIFQSQLTSVNTTGLTGTYLHRLLRTAIFIQLFKDMKVDWSMECTVYSAPKSTNFKISNVTQGGT